MDRKQIADLIFDKLSKAKVDLHRMYSASKGKIGYFYLDDVLPEELARKIFNHFPRPGDMTLKRSIREYKYIAAQMDRYEPLLEDTIFAFQDSRIVELISEICGIKKLYPDDNLYAGGISLMGKGNFLHPHLDNSHDKDRNQWRVLNLLYYVTPEWQDANGGNLEIWPEGMKEKQITIHSRFNRLAVMSTHHRSWHSVSPIISNNVRCCVSNYYFSSEPLLEEDSFHVTTFRGRPGQKLRNLILKLDSTLRMCLRSLFPKGVRENPHVYKKED